MVHLNWMAAKRCLHVIAVTVFVAALGWSASPAHAFSGYAYSMVLTVTPGVDTAPNNPCATKVVAGTFVNNGTCGLRGAIDLTDKYLQNFTTSSACPTAPNPGGLAQPAVHIIVNAGTYALTFGGLILNGACDSDKLDAKGSINNFVLITGAGPASTKIDGSGNAASRHPASVFTEMVPLQMTGLTITGGQGEDFGSGCPCGGGINGNLDQGLSLNNVVITHNSALGANSGRGGGLYENDWNSISLTNVRITQNAAGSQGGGIWNSGGLISTHNVTVSGNIACDKFSNSTAAPWAGGNLCIDTGTPQGGGIWDSAGLGMVGGVVTGNLSGSLATGYGAGGGIYLSSNFGQVVLNNVIVANNVAGNAGGGIQNQRDFVMTGGRLENNKSGSIAGGLGDDACDNRSSNGGYVCAGGHSGSSTFSGTTIAGNSAGGTFDCKTVTTTTCANDVGAGHHGFTSGACPASLATGEYCSSSSGVGGGVYVNSAVYVTGGGIIGNTAVSIGSGAASTRRAVTTCNGAGGGVFNRDSLLEMQDSQLSNNTASCGGGDYVEAYAGNNLFSVKIHRNYAKYFGGAFYANAASGPVPSGVMLLNATTVSDNAAGVETGGIYATHFGVFLVEGATSIASNSGGGCPNTNHPCS